MCTNNCPFFIVAKMIEASWSIQEIWNPNYNRFSTIAAFYPSLCKLHLISTIISEIKWATKVNLKLAAIFDSLQLAQRSNFDDNQPSYKTKDINNIKADLR